MTRTFPIAIACALLIAGGGAACGAEAMTMDHSASVPGHGSAAAGGAPVSGAYAASNAAMMKGMDVKPSGDADRDFVAMMLPHHRGAVDMARVELRYGKDPMLRKMAADIVRSQAIEIDRMQVWGKQHAR